MCIVIKVFAELLFCLLYYCCPECVFILTAAIAFMLLFAIAQWLIASTDCACSSMGVVETSKVRYNRRQAPLGACVCVCVCVCVCMQVHMGISRVLLHSYHSKQTCKLSFYCNNFTVNND